MKAIKTEQSGEIFKGITHLGGVAEIERNIAVAKGDIQVEQSNLLADSLCIPGDAPLAIPAANCTSRAPAGEKGHKIPCFGGSTHST